MAQKQSTGDQSGILLYILKAAKKPGWGFFLQGAPSRWGNKGAMEEGMKEF